MPERQEALLAAARVIAAVGLIVTGERRPAGSHVWVSLMCLPLTQSVMPGEERVSIKQREL